MKVNLCGINIDALSFDEVISITQHKLLCDREPKYIVTPNAQHIVTLQKDLHFQKIYQNAFLSVPDGVPLLWAAKLIDTPLKDRVNGTDLFEKLCEVSAKKGFKVFLLGGRPQAADNAAKILCQKYPQLKIVGTYCPPYGFEKDKTELEKIEKTIKVAAPDILFVGLGAPKQEKWIDANYQKLGIPISIGIGVSFELVSGMVRRAPKWMQRTGLEWFYRLIVEPRRLWKRYIFGNVFFIFLVLKQRFRLT